VALYVALSDFPSCNSHFLTCNSHFLTCNLQFSTCNSHFLTCTLQFSTHNSPFLTCNSHFSTCNSTLDHKKSSFSVPVCVRINRHRCIDTLPIENCYRTADREQVGYRTTLLQLDLSSAFDTLDTSTRTRLRRFRFTYGISGPLNWVSSYLVCRSQSVGLYASDRNSHRASFVSRPTYGVPPGSVQGLK